MVLPISTSRKLSRVEINLLKHLTRYSTIGCPIIVPIKFKDALAPLWRRGFIDIWYRQDRDACASRRSQFVSVTFDGQRRIASILANQPEFPSRRLAGFQGRNTTHDQPSEPEQEQDN